MLIRTTRFRHTRFVRTLLASIAIAAPAMLGAQQPDRAPAPSAGPKVGDVAPDFLLPGSTKDGTLPNPIHLSELKGQVVVLAFFPKARTSG